MIRFRLVGGPFDGATHGAPWKEAPPAIWVTKDSTSRGPLGLRAWPRQRPGATPYNYADLDGEVFVYIFSSLTDEGWYEVVNTLSVAA